MERDLRVNQRIRASRVRLVDETGKQVGIVSIKDALRYAEEKGLDLVEVAPNADPPVCRVMDYGKYKYQQQIKDRKGKKAQHVIKIKELRLRPNIDRNDLRLKIEKAREFLKEGNKVKFTLLFRGRELAHTELGYELMKTVCEELEEHANIERPPKGEGRTIVTILSPK
ncbi:MAG: translation initiation factor IF-3, partial [Candidatus Neomarinimicrobiota bacterium]